MKLTFNQSRLGAFIAYAIKYNIILAMEEFARKVNPKATPALIGTAVTGMFANRAVYFVSGNEVKCGLIARNKEGKFGLWYDCHFYFLEDGIVLYTSKEEAEEALCPPTPEPTEADLRFMHNAPEDKFIEFLTNGLFKGIIPEGVKVHVVRL